MSTLLFFLITSLLSTLVAAAPAQNHGKNLVTAPKTTKPGCPRKCGNVTIPYPFGIGPSCSFNSFYSLTCDTSSDSPKALLKSIPKVANNSETPRSVHEIVDISETQFRVRTKVLYNCHIPNKNITKSEKQGMYLPPDSPFVFSRTANKVVVVGCGYYTKFTGQTDNTSIIISSSYCLEKASVVAGDCLGSNGCQEDEIIENDIIREYYFFVARPTPFSIPYDHCGYAFMGETKEFKFEGLSDFLDPSKFVERIMINVPLVVEWVMGNNTTCKEAKKDVSSYGCQKNSTCIDANSGIGGYRCVCLPGYEGNPYLSPGCTEIIECPLGYEADGSACELKFAFKLIIGLGISLLCLSIGVTWIYTMIRKQRLLKLQEKMFTKNGGLLLQKQLSSIVEGGSEPIKIFTEKELKMATNNFSRHCIAGRGAHGTVYKGVLDDNRVIAIKKSMILDEDEIQQFINELVILSQINHKNIVKLVGCCLEVEVPLLIYEFVQNGALFNHIHNGVHGSWLDWRNCLRIVSEIADALEYLHSAVYSPIIHRDVKSANILLDQNYLAKVSDFGGSKVIPVDQTKICTAVQGTLGYLDPEYLFTSQLTEKSDVYSFGVLVAEILTRKKAVFQVNGSEFRNLATYFVESIKKEQLHLILDAQIAKKAPIEEVMLLGEIVDRCLSLKGDDRPTMKQIAVQLNRLVSRVLVNEETINSLKTAFNREKNGDRNLAKYFVNCFKQGRILELIYPRIVEEAPQEQLRWVAEIVHECLHVKGANLPMMKDVATELAGVLRQTEMPNDINNKGNMHHCIRGKTRKGKRGTISPTH